MSENFTAKPFSRRSFLTLIGATALTTSMLAACPPVAAPAAAPTAEPAAESTGPDPKNLEPFVASDTGGEIPDLPRRIAWANTSDAEFFLAITNAIQLAAEDRDLEFITAIANDDSAKNIEQISTFLQRGIAALCIQPLDANAQAPLMQQAIDSGVEVMEAEMNDAEALQILTPGWLDMFINIEWTMPRRVPWFGAENVEASKVAEAEAMKTPNAVCGITDANGVSWGLPFTDVRDTVAGTLLVLDSPDAIGDVFNMVGLSATALVPAAKLIAEHTDRPYIEVKMPFLWWFNVANNRARSVLGYNPQYDFPDMVDGAVAYLRGENIGVVPV